MKNHLKFIFAFSSLFFLFFVGVEQIQNTRMVIAEKKNLLAPVNLDEKGTMSYLNYLEYLSITEKSVKIAVIGSSVTKGSGASKQEYQWPNQLIHYLKRLPGKDFSKLSLHNYGVSRFKAKDLIANRQVDKLIFEKPKLVIFETSVINNFRQSTPMNDTLFYIEELLRTIQEGLPDAKILVISPNPISDKGKNKSGYFYQDYLEETGQFIVKNGYDYINMYEGINQYLSKEKLSLNNILADGIHPNDEGYRIWFEVLRNYLEHMQVIIE
ncbi:SGNH/GDSL hydrolase family protein [Caldibacillus lycopersici]|uniref:SGNH/GDSL hydrolase family protein n=1 Tax=Perspicuibacillus lycopersici TaxID=1325689 RepID=A0AAE3LM63_9BACI|nr:SGNH/GDSL hydrolase family protein [Perspicuibacillus lycopersici]MCU9612387.1 SGNH/GDSL hydrolase family protein [Perspicuibacillus lycopersici]